MYSVSASKIKRKTKKKNNEFCIFEKQTNFKRWMYKSISFQSVELAYQIDGKGSAIVLVHGFCEDSSIWDFYTRRWQNQFLVLRLDLPGFGKSQILTKWTFEEVADALNQILSKENISSCYLIGHSMGGYFSMAFAEKYEDKLKGLCLFHSHPYADSAEKVDNRKKSVALIERWGSYRFVQALIPELFHPEFQKSRGDLLSDLIKRASQIPVKALVAASQAMWERKDRAEFLKNKNFPIHFILGLHDKTIPIEKVFEAMELPSIKDKLILQDSAHMGMFEEEESCYIFLTKQVKNLLK